MNFSQGALYFSIDYLKTTKYFYSQAISLAVKLAGGYI